MKIWFFIGSFILWVYLGTRAGHSWQVPRAGWLGLTFFILVLPRFFRWLKQLLPWFSSPRVECHYLCSGEYLDHYKGGTTDKCAFGYGRIYTWSFYHYQIFQKAVFPFLISWKWWSNFPLHRCCNVFRSCLKLPVDNDLICSISSFWFHFPAPLTPAP